MAFWSDPSELFPKQSHRWVVYLGSADDSLPHYFAKSIDRPSYETGVVQTKYLYSHTINFPKRVTWRPIKIDFYDVFINNGNESIFRTPESVSDKEEKIWYSKSTQLFFYNFLINAGYRGPNDAFGLENNSFLKKYNFKESMFDAFFGKAVDDFSKDNSNSYSNTKYFTIQEVNEDGGINEVWQIYNPLVTSVNFNKLDYSIDNILSITVDIAYDWAELVPRIETRRDKSEYQKARDEIKKLDQPFPDRKKTPTRDPVIYDMITPDTTYVIPRISNTYIEGEATEKKDGLFRPGIDTKANNL